MKQKTTREERNKIYNKVSKKIGYKNNDGEYICNILHNMDLSSDLNNYPELLFIIIDDITRYSNGGFGAIIMGEGFDNLGWSEFSIKYNLVKQICLDLAQLIEID